MKIGSCTVVIIAVGVFCTSYDTAALGQVVEDGTTPPSMAPGSPEGSYALSGIDKVDLYSGKVNLAIPIHAVHGRGPAGACQAF